MPAFLTLSKADQKTAIEQAAAHKGWAAASVEKDFWVCWTLEKLFTTPLLQGRLTFKGGTSLSKAWKLIDRFSEDIDLTIDREALGFGGEHSPEQAASNKQKNKRLKDLRQACANFVQKALLSELVEQVTLHEEAARPVDKPLKPRMARHYYDLFRLIEAGVGKAAAEDLGLFKQVLAHRSVFFAQSWVDYGELRPELLAFLPSREQEAHWREDYVAMQAEMFATEPPAFEQILSSIKEFQDSRLK